MNENDGSAVPGFDADTAPDLSTDGWPEKFAKTPVRRDRARKGDVQMEPAGIEPATSCVQSRRSPD